MQNKKELEKLSKRKGKVDRQREQWRERKWRERIDLTPRSELEAVINDLSKKIREVVRSRTPNESIQLYNNSRNLRHDVWVELLRASSTDTNYQFGDVKVETFIRHIVQLSVNIPDKIKNLTPDILSYNKRSNFVYLGDVAVSVSTQMTNSRKYLKYYEVEKFLKSQNIKVKHINLIIDHNLNNVHSQLSGLAEVGLITIRKDLIQRAIEYSTVCQKIMTYSIEICEDKEEFLKLQDICDKTGDRHTEDIDIPEWILTEDVNPEQPAIAEDRIIRWIKLETDKLENTFFDNGIDNSIKAFNDLIDENKNKNEYTHPKPVLQVIHNTYEYCEQTNYDLLTDYIKDIHHSNEEVTRRYLTEMLPTISQVEIMKKLANAPASEYKKYKDKQVFGPYQYSRVQNSDLFLTRDMNQKLIRGKKVKNEKNVPKTIDPELYDNCFGYIESSIHYLGERSNKKPFLDDTWDAKTNFEISSTKKEKEIYDYSRTTCGAQLAHSLSGLYQRIMHVKTSLSTKDNIYIPPNGAFIAIIPKNHAPVTSPRCDLPIIFVTRVKNSTKETTDKIIVNEYEHTITGDQYTYYISKLCRINVDKMSSWDQAGYRLVASSTHLMSICPELWQCKERVIGILTFMMLDLHQKASEYLDLLKYVAFMPFSDISCLSQLIKDKFNLLIKTSLDVWLLLTMKDFIIELSNKEKLNAKKPKIQLFNCSITRESMGINMNLPSFISKSVRHNSVTQYIEEITMIYIVRPKHLYGSQFMDTAINNIALWNKEYEEEKLDYGDWATTGRGAGKFPFDSKFCYSRDTIIHAMNLYHKTMAINKKKVTAKLTETKYCDYMHYNCSLRGCTKEINDRKNINDIHTTSMEACLRYYEDQKYDDRKCTVTSIAVDNLSKGQTQQYSMSEKDQRGGGRPISTPTLGVKAALMVIEKPEQAIGTQVDNNIIVPGKNKLNEQCNAYKSLLSNGAIKGYKEVYQLTEDQTKFSENDNVRKYEVYIKNNKYLPYNVRALQLKSIKQINNREHLVHRLPKSILDSSELRKYINSEQNGVKANIGWPQGMLNFISTSVHSIADIWITYAFNKAYPNSKVMTKGLVHSDDSWVTVACNNKDEFKKFAIFRSLAKRLFCLKINIKKLWGSRHLGELVSNYNINGNVHLSISKVLANSFGNLIYQNWVMDVHTQISSLQQAYRNGATIPTLILLGTVLRQQLIDSYQVSGEQKRLLYLLPIELGGYPDNSALELGVTGVTCHYKRILESIKNTVHVDQSNIILRALRLSIIYNIKTELGDQEILKMYTNRTDLIKNYYSKDPSKIVDVEKGIDIDNVDFESIVIPSRGNVFTCIKHILPKSKKMTLTIAKIKSLPFVGDNLEMIITKPIELSTALGNLKTQTASMIYTLAAEKYTQSSRRLAVAQAIQSSGKVVRLGPFKPMTFNELITFLKNSENITPMPASMLATAFDDETGITNICEAVVYRSDAIPTNTDKRKILNRIPEVDNKFKTICPLKSVLLYIIDEQMQTKYREKYTNMQDQREILEQDAKLVMIRFRTYFTYYKVKIACNLIMTQYISQLKTKLWTQPHLRTDTIVNFIEDLYGKTISNVQNYKVDINLSGVLTNKHDANIVETLYTVEIINNLYENRFKSINFNGKSIVDTLKGIDYSTLSGDTYAKYAVLMKLRCNTEQFLYDFDEKKQYDQLYIQPQKFAEGKFYGEFVCIARYGNSVIKISGEPENLKISASNTNLQDILTCMMIFVKENFNYYQYSHPNLWFTTGFWRSPAKFSDMYINSYSSIVTIINQSRTPESLAFKLDERIMMPDTYHRLRPDGFEISPTLKEIHKIINGKKIKVCSLKQGLSCPELSKVEIEPDLIEGMDNQYLLNSKLIINVTMKRHYNTSRKVYRTALEGRLSRFEPKVVLDMWRNLLSKFVEIQVDTIEEENYLESCIVKTFDIEGSVASQVLEEGTLTTPEDLTYVDTKYIYVEDDRVGAIYKHKSLVKLFSEILASHVSDSDVLDLIWLLLKDTEIIKIIKREKARGTEQIEGTVGEIIDYIHAIDISPDLYTLIVGKMLNNKEKWDTIDIKQLLKRKYINVKNSVLYDIAFELKSKILEIWEDKEISSDESLTDLLL